MKRSRSKTGFIPLVFDLERPDQIIPARQSDSTQAERRCLGRETEEIWGY